MRIGINTGEVIAVTDARPGEALATGDAVNAAARLEQAARPGQVLVSERTAQAARGFRFDAAAGARAARQGRAAARRRARRRAARRPKERSPGSVPLVGRRRELELLTTTYQRVVEEERPHLVTLYGEAGVGKSRLVAELLAELEAGSPPPIAVRGRCLAYGDGITYWPLAELLKAHAHALDSDPAEVALARVTDAPEAVLARAGVDRPAETATILALSIGLAPVDQHRNPQELRAETALRVAVVLLGARGGGADGRDRRRRALGRHGDARAARGRRRARRRPGAHPLHGAAGADDAAADVGWRPRSFTGLVVDPLGEAESAGSSSCCSAEGVGEGDRPAILARAEGNPFFLEEIVRARGFGPSRRRRHPRHCPGRARRAHRPAAARREARAPGGRRRRPGVLAGSRRRGRGPRRRRASSDAARPPAGPRSRARASLVVDERPARVDLQARARPRRRVSRACRGATGSACTATPAAGSSGRTPAAATRSSS